MSNGTRDPDQKTEHDIDEGVEESFPASDPPSRSQPSTAAPAVEGSAPPEPAPRQVFRVVERERAEQAYSVESNTRSGRWTSDGVPAIYAAGSAAGALLEYLAHLEGDSPEELVVVTAQLPGGAVTVADTLPPQWRERPYRSDVRAYGDGWIANGKSLALEVPSVVCPSEHNVLINPLHPDAAQLKIRAIDPLHIDPRLRY